MPDLKPIPKTKGLDYTIRLLREGYPFIPNLMKELHTDIFQTRLMGKKCICITGKDAAKLFYNPEYFIRNKANPKRIQKTLFGVNAIQTMDGEAHLHRKLLFLSILSSTRINDLREIVRTNYLNAISEWKDQGQICLFNETASILCKSTCEWCDITITPEEARIRAEEFMTMVYAIAQIGPNYWKGKSARKRTEDWIEAVVIETRNGKRKPRKETALYQIATYRDIDGTLLSDREAAIELINVIRPIVAISIYIVYTALALHEHPEYKEFLKDPKDPFYTMFVQEVRRYYPLGPFLGAKVKKEFTWHNYLFKEGTLVFLDAYGMNIDPAIWKKPTTFYPENFLNWDNDHYELIPQGGGDLKTGHRCPGETITIDLMKDAIDFLVNTIQYTLPPQNLTYSLKKIPTLPESGFLMTNIRKKS